MNRSRRVLIVGAHFGESYLNAFLKRRPGLELAGVLARGSARARQLAHAFGVPLYTDLERIPADVDIACVVVRSTVVGGRGSAIAQALLERGIHVIQEHPLHPDEMRRLQQLATQRSLHYWVNTFYPHCAASRRWIEAAYRIHAQLGAASPSFAHLTTSRQLLYSALDLLSQAGGWDPDGIKVDGVFGEPDATFRLLRLRMPGAEAALHLQATMDPSDPDQHSQVMHQAMLVWPSGYLTLVASHGPVTWTPALHLPGHSDECQSLYRQDADAGGFATPTTCLLHQETADWRDALEIDGADGVAMLLQQLAQCLEGQPTPAGCHPDYQLALASLWQRVSQAAGPVRETALPVPASIDLRSLTPIRA